MQIFKLFFKIINKYKMIIIVMMSISFGLSIMAVRGNNTTDVEKVSFVVVDQDKSEASKALAIYLKQYGTQKTLSENEIEDALFYRDIQYVLYVPKGYEETLKKNEKIIFDKKQLVDAPSAYLMDQNVTEFSNALQDHYVLGNINISDAIEKANEDLSIKVHAESVASTVVEPVKYYFNFLSYSLVSTLIIGISIAILAMNKVDIKRRNVISPISNLRKNINLFLASLTLGILMFVISIGFAFALFSDGMSVPGSYLYIMNLAVFVVPAIGIAYFIGNIARTSEAVSGISNIVCLGMAFLGGAFVEQEFLSDTVLQFSKFIPSYWFVNANDRIYELVDTSLKHTRPIYEAMGVQLLFGIVFFFVTVMISKYKNRNVL